MWIAARERRSPMPGSSQLLALRKIVNERKRGNGDTVERVASTVGVDSRKDGVGIDPFGYVALLVIVEGGDKAGDP